MALASTFEEKNRVINDIFSKMSPDEKKIMLKLLIKDDMKSYFEIIWEEQKRLEKETGVDRVYEYTSEKAWADGEEVTQNDEKETGLEINLAGKVSKEAENAYYFDEKPAKKDKNDTYDGFLGYVNSSGNDENEDKNDSTFEKSEIQFEDQTVSKNNQIKFETTLEPGEFIDKIADKIEELEMKNKMKNMKFPDFGDKKEA